MSDSLTPSEIIFLNSSDFVSKKRRGSAPFTGAAKVNRKELVMTLFKATLIGMVQTGSIRLATTAEGKLGIQPTENPIVWPDHTLESRLQPNQPTSLASLVQGWTPTAEQVIANMQVLLTLRKRLRVQATFSGAYRYHHLPTAESTDGLVAKLKADLAQFQQDHPETAAQLEQILQKELQLTGWGEDPNASYDPWLKESEDSRNWVKETYGLDFGQQKNNQIIIVGSIVWIITLGLIILTYVQEGAGALPSMLLVMAMVLFIVNQYLRWKLLQPDKAREKFLAELLLYSGLFIIVMTVFASFPLIILIIAGLMIAQTFTKRLQQRANQAITETVTKKTTPAKPLEDKAPQMIVPDDLPEVTEIVDPPKTTASPLLGEQLRVHLVDQIDRQAISEESRRRVAAVHGRNFEINKLYYGLLPLISAAVGVTVLLAWLLDCTPETYNYISGTQMLQVGEARFPIGTILFMGFSLYISLILNRLIKQYFTQLKEDKTFSAQLESTAWSLTDRMNPFDQWKKHGTLVSYRPYVIFGIGILWVWISLSWMDDFAAARPAYRWVFILLAFVIPAVYLVRTFWRSKQIREQYPVYPPFNLLSLRVFGESALPEYLGMISKWRWLGLTYLLDGPDTAGSKQSDLSNYLKGELDKSIVKSEQELHRELNRFSREPDDQLRYEIHSMQCNDASWQIALHTLLDQADVVIMDLSGFSAENRGCEYELGNLINELPLERFFLIVNDNTDLPYLTKTL